MYFFKLSSRKVKKVSHNFFYIIFGVLDMITFGDVKIIRPRKKSDGIFNFCVCGLCA